MAHQDADTVIWLCMGGCKVWYPIGIKIARRHEPCMAVGVESGGCSGLVYKLDFDDNMSNEDELVEHNDIKLVINKKSILFLAGTTLEYSSGLNGKGFVFNNPNANRTCGCGESFSL